MLLAVNILGVVVFLAAGWLFSHNRKGIHWQSVGILTALNLVIAWVLTSFPWGRAAVQGAAAGFNELVSVAWKGINFALANWVGAEGVDPAPVNFIVSALLPILLVVPVFDILTYIGLLPWVIKWVGRGLSLITRQPRFETFYSIEMMFLGNTEALAVSKLQVQKMNPARNVVIAMMSMSCVTASILAAYIQMVPAEFVLTAVPINCLNALIVTSMLYPVDVPPEEDIIVSYENEDEDEAVPVAAASEAGSAVGSDDAEAAVGAPWDMAEPDPEPLVEWTPFSPAEPFTNRRTGFFSQGLTSSEPPANMGPAAYDSPEDNPELYEATLTPEALARMRQEESATGDTIMRRVPDAAPTTPSAFLIYAGSAPVEVVRDVIIGRDPNTRVLTGRPMAAPLRVPSPGSEISRSHCAVMATAPGVWSLMDLASVNGSILVHPDGSSEDAPAMVGVPLADGDLIDLGEGVTVEFRVR